jgi:hypothetical protein
MEENAIISTVRQLVEQHGGLRKAARAIQINYAYLSRLGAGKKVNPTTAVLKKLGLERTVTIRKANGTPTILAGARSSVRKRSARSGNGG